MRLDFVLIPTRWDETTNAIGIVTKGGRYDATYSHKNITFEFASWISPEFKLYIIEDYQRLVLADMESYNAILIKQEKSQAERMQLLHELAV